LLPELGQESKYIYSQIWLNLLVADCHFWSNMRKFKKIQEKKKKPGHRSLFIYNKIINKKPK
jgi:hypothetical protein